VAHNNCKGKFSYSGLVRRKFGRKSAGRGKRKGGKTPGWRELTTKGVSWKNRKSAAVF